MLSTSITDFCQAMPRRFDSARMIALFPESELQLRLRPHTELAAAAEPFPRHVDSFSFSLL